MGLEHSSDWQARRIRELEQQLAERDRRMQAVLRISQALSSRIRLDDLLQTTLEESMRTVGANGGTIYLYDPEEDVLVFKYVVGPKAEELMGMKIKADQGIAGEVFQTGEPKITEDVTKEKRHLRDIDAKTKYSTRNMITVPLKTSVGEPIGVMQVLNKEGDGVFTEDDLELLMILATQAATAIETARLHEEARLAVVVKLMGDISHDVKNMITPIHVGAETLKMLLDDFFTQFEEQRERLQAVCGEQAEALFSTVEMLKGFYPEAIEMFLSGSRAVQDRVREIADCVKGIVSEPHFEFLDLRRVVQEVITPLKMVASQQGVEIVPQLPEDLPPVPMDYRQIYNALYNLINNAIGAMAEAKERHRPMGGHRIYIRAYVQPEGTFPQGDYLHIEVADEGPGMPEEVRRRLFTKDAISTKPGGTGLGTRIVKNAVDAHGGQVWVESELGKGSTFFIRIPLHRPEAEQAPQP